MQVEIRNLNSIELTEILYQNGYQKFRAKQIFNWLNKKLICNFDEMSNLPLKLIKYLEANFVINTLSIQNKLHSKYNNVIKYLYKLNDGNIIESVIMEYKYGYSVCISTQVGCKMGCIFCTSGENGFVRNLSPAEMLEQVLMAQKQTTQKINHVTLMGIGEPFNNYENVIKFLNLISSDEGFNISKRNISISTSGIVEKIYEFMKHKYQYTLSVSLHAPNNEIRNQIMPINRKWNINALMKVCKEYFDCTKRRITFEYLMINGLNDTPKCAKELVHLLKDISAHVNLIQLNEKNENKKSFLKPSKPRNIKIFKQILTNMNIQTTQRRTLGSDISAACGQLKQKFIETRAANSKALPCGYLPVSIDRLA